MKFTHDSLQITVPYVPCSAWVKSCSKGFRTMLDTDCDRIKENAIILQNRGEIGKWWENDGKWWENAISSDKLFIRLVHLVNLAMATFLYISDFKVHLEEHGKRIEKTRNLKGLHYRPISCYIHGEFGLLFTRIITSEPDPWCGVFSQVSKSWQWAAK